MAAVPFQRPGLLDSVGLTRAQGEREAWAIAPDGQRYPGAAAVLAALAWATGVQLLLGLYALPGLRQLADATYALIAANRSRLPGITPYCKEHPEDCV